MDFMVTEAVVLKAMKEEAEAHDKAKKDKWKQDTSGLDKFR